MKSLLILTSSILLAASTIACATSSEDPAGSSTSAVETAARKIRCEVSSDDAPGAPIDFELRDAPMNSFTVPAKSPLLAAPSIISVTAIADTKELHIMLVAHNAALPQGMLIQAEGTMAAGATLTWQMALGADQEKHEVRVHCQAAS